MMATERARIRRIQRARRRRYPGPGRPEHYSVDECIKDLEKARQRTPLGRAGCWRSRAEQITYWRQALTLATAYRRAKAGDRTAQYRLAWREAVRKWRQHAEWLASRFWAIDRDVERMLRHGAPCAGCAGRLERLRENRALSLAEIALLPGMTSYAVFVHEGPPPTLDQDGEWWREEADEDSKTPEHTVALAEALAHAGVSSERQEEYQRKMSTLLGSGGA